MPDWEKSADIVIVGGGIMGLCLAYHLALRGQRKAVLFERDLLAQASTGLCAGGVRQQFSHPANILLSQRTVSLFERFGEEFGVDIHFRQAGYLFLAQRAETWAEFLTGVRTQRRLGVPVEVLTPEEIGRRWPYLKVTDLAGGTFCNRDGYADPHLVAMAFADQARRLGVRIMERTEVTEILTRGDRTTGVETSRGSIEAPVVVNTAGPWAAEVSRRTGIELPVKPFRRQVLMTRPFRRLPRPVPMVIDMDELFYFRGEDPGILMGMTDPSEPSSFSTVTDRTFLEKVVARAVWRAPVLEDAGILRGWAGLYEVTPDGNPLIGAVIGLEGYYCAVGFSGHGFQHGPAVGQILGQLILEGRTEFDLSPFDPSRFSSLRTKGECRTV